MQLEKDNYMLGVLIGLALPFLGFVGFYQWKFSMVPVQTFIDLLASQKSILSAMCVAFTQCRCIDFLFSKTN